MKETHKKIIVTIIGIIAIFSIAGFAIWVSNDGQPDAGGSDGKYRNYVEGVFVNTSMDIVDFSEEIADDGGICYERNNITYHYAEKTYNLTITNNQSTYIDVWMLFHNPNPEIKGWRKYGLHNDLETDTITVFCKKYKFAFYGCGYSEKWDKEDWNWIDENGCYNNNWLFADRIYPNKTVIVPIIFYIERSYPGTFMDGQYYTNNAFWMMRKYPDSYNTYQIQKTPFEVRT